MRNRYCREDGENDFERAFGVTYADGNCPICLQPITNPMGTECYLKHVDMWLDSQGMSSIESQIVKAHIRKRLPRNDLNSDVCVTCGKEHLSVCSYCFVFVASKVLRELNFARDFEKDFEYMFSYKGGSLNEIENNEEV